MVQIAPNWARISGRVVDVGPAADLPDFLDVRISLEQISPISGQRNLFTQAPGDVLSLYMGRSLAEQLSVRIGVYVECEARRADLRRAFVHPERIRVSESPFADPPPWNQQPP
jgi:hypothetical protein